MIGYTRMNNFNRLIGRGDQVRAIKKMAMPDEM
jgi:hypothetical protein